MVDLADTAVVAILTRAPSSGGKTRLFQSLGCEADPGLLTALLLDTLDAAAAPGVQRVVVVDPPEACGEVRALVGAVEVIPQVPGTLGERMAGALSELFARGAAAVVLVGSDLPDLPTGVVAEAIDTLRRDAGVLVLGPARDGGYYLIGATTVPPVFADVAWGSASVLARTLALAERSRIRVQLLDVVADVDTKDELARSRGPRTREWVARHAGLMEP